MIFGIFFSFHFSRWRHVTKYSFYSGDLMKSMQSVHLLIVAHYSIHRCLCYFSATVGNMCNLLLFYWGEARTWGCWL